MERQRDNQRARLYVADNVLRKHAKPLPEMADLRAFVGKVLASKRVQKAFRVAVCKGDVEIHDGRCRRNAGGNYRGIWMPRWARTTDVTLHELAHCFTHREYGWHTAGHGWEFCATYLTLVLYMMGRDAHDELKASFKKHRVRFTARRKVVMTPERAASLVRARLASPIGKTAPGLSKAADAK